MSPHSAGDPQSVAREEPSPRCAIFAPKGALMALFFGGLSSEMSDEKRRRYERSTVAPSLGTERANCGLEYGAAVGPMAVICNRNSANRVLGTTLDNHTDAMTRQRATALIANAGHGNAVDGEPRRTDTDDFTAVRSRVIEANDVRHTQVSFDGLTLSSNSVGGNEASGTSAYFTRRQTVLVRISALAPFMRSMSDKSRLIMAAGIASPCWKRRGLPCTSRSGHCQYPVCGQGVPVAASSPNGSGFVELV